MHFELLLPAATLNTYAAYSFGVVVTSSDASIPASGANVTFVVCPTAPVALIAGAQYRTFVVNDALSLDASSSFDLAHVARGSSQLAFFWQFPTLTTATPMTSACQAQHVAFLSTWVTLDLMTPQLMLAAQSNLLCVGLEYRFSVVVSHANLPAAFANEPSSTAFAIVVADAAPLPPVADTVVHSLTVDIAPLDADKFFLAAFPPGERLRLQATVTHTVVTYGGELQLSPSGAPSAVVIETARVEDTHTDVDIGGGYRLVYRSSETHAYFDARDVANLAGTPDVSSLILGADTLSPSLAGVTTTLRLDVTLVSPLGAEEATAYSKVGVTLNASPTVQTATMDATTGLAGSTQFALECVGAVDKDEPLQFIFSYAFAYTPTELVPLSTRISSPRMDALLPVGTLFVVCNAFDSFGAKSLPSTATPLVTVAPLLYLVERDANNTCSTSTTLVDALALAVLAQQSVVLSLQQISSYFTSVLAEACATLECSVYNIFIDSIASLAATTTANDELDDATAQQLASSLATVTQNSTMCTCPAAFATAAAVITDLIAATNTANAGTNSSAPVANQALTKGGTTAVLASLSGALSSLVAPTGSTVCDCSLFADVSALVEATLAASSAGSLAGETSAGIDTASFVASTTRVNGASSGSSATVTTLSSSSLQFDFPAESVADLACADLHIVVYAAPAVACRSDASTAAAATAASGGSASQDTSGSGLNQPASTIVEADIVDCAGNVVSIANLTVPVSFLVPLALNSNLEPSTITEACGADSAYLPNGGDVVSKQVVVEKDVECTFFDEETQQWSSDGCVVAVDNVVQADGSRAVRCECTHLTEFAILLRAKNSQDATECNNAPASVFGSIVFLVFACLFSMLLVVGGRQTYLTVWDFRWKQKSMLIQHALLCVVCAFRIIICVIYYELQHASMRANIEFRAVAAVSGLPYICMLWLFSLLVTNWAAIYFAARRNDLAGLASAFKRVRPHFIRANVFATLLFFALFVTIGASTSAKLHASLTLAGSVIYSIVAFSMSVAFATFGYGVMKQLSKDFKSTSAMRLCNVGMVFCACFSGEAAIWLISGTAPDLFFKHFEVINSVFFSLELIALICILLVSRRTLAEGVRDKQGALFKPMMIRQSRRNAIVMPKNSKGSDSKVDSQSGSRPASADASQRGSFAGRT
jgi:hypothetical protein